MSTKIYQEWKFAENLSQVKNDVQNFNFDEYIIVQPQEHYFYGIDYEIIDKFLLEKNSYLTIYIGCELDNNILYKYKRIRFILWDSIDFFSKFFRYTTYLNSTEDEALKFYNYLKDFPPIKHFTSLINIKSYRFWRIYVINELHKNNLINYGNFSFSISDADLELFNKTKPHMSFTYNNVKEDIPIFTDLWKPQNNAFYRREIDNQSFIENIFISNRKRFNSHIIDFEYLICAFDIVLESTYDYFFVTEKTLRSIDSKKPFLVFSCKDYHKKLKEKYGFRLFDNIIDYSFDSEENTIVRWNKLLFELVKLRTMYTPTQIKQLTTHDVCYNYDNLIKMRNKNLVNVPKDFIEYNNDHYYTYKCFTYKKNLI